MFSARPRLFQELTGRNDRSYSVLMGEFEYKEQLVALSDEELEQSMCVILAAYSEHFPQLRSKAVRPDLRDQERKLFAREMVARLKASRIVFSIRPRTGLCRAREPSCRAAKGQNGQRGDC